MASSTMSSQARLDEELPVQRLTKADLSAVTKVFLTGAVVVVVVLVVVVGGVVVVFTRVVVVGGVGILFPTLVDHGPTWLSWLIARTENE